ncbi:MAG: sugar kinase [Saprospiraceae bacterium]|jgi:2-dehydro-3-deoxygluconokinase|nr:sugar kinase [Saprospiraceae bacterium]
MKKIISFGETMLRLTPPGNQRFAQANSLEIIIGGAESNVAVSLARFGMDVEWVSRLPENDMAERLLQELRKHGVGLRHVVRGGERVGIYFLENGASQRGSKVVYDRANSSMATLQPGMIDWEAAFAGADWFHWSGITPAISQSAADACREAIETANRMGLTVSTDLNHRAALWKYGKQPSEVMPELTAGCHLIVGAAEDVRNYFGIVPEGNGEEAQRSMLAQLKSRFPRAKWVATTLRSNPNASQNGFSGLLWDGQQFCEAPSYPVTHIVDRVGTGDAFTAGLIFGLRSYPTDPQRALHFGVAAATLKHSIPGDINLVTREEVEALMAGNATGRVSR